MASVFYPIGVSLYSVALVAYPSLLAPASSTADRGRKAGWIYAIAGWFGSAMGIGMGQNLGHVPVAFVVFAGGLLFALQIFDLFRRRRRELGATVAVLTFATLLQFAVAGRSSNSGDSSALKLSPEGRGRQVYIAEGCINCHSQYIRPNTSDVVLWGPAQMLEAIRRERPPLIGNRRQGPDLANVGNRRSPLWLKAHLYSPAELNRTSFMPSYAHLFRSRQGDDLVAYLKSLHGSDYNRVLTTADWQLPTEGIAQANAADGARLFDSSCATCHGADGRTRNTWGSGFQRLLPNLTSGPLSHLRTSDTPAERRQLIARIIKFGIPGTDMPGHEYLPDEEIASIGLWIAMNQSQPVQETAMPFSETNITKDNK